MGRMCRLMSRPEQLRKPRSATHSSRHKRSNASVQHMLNAVCCVVRVSFLCCGSAMPIDFGNRQFGPGMAGTHEHQGDITRLVTPVGAVNLVITHTMHNIPVFQNWRHCDTATVNRVFWPGFGNCKWTLGLCDCATAVDVFLGEAAYLTAAISVILFICDGSKEAAHDAAD